MNMGGIFCGVAWRASILVVLRPLFDGASAAGRRFCSADTVPALAGIFFVAYTILILESNDILVIQEVRNAWRAI